MPYRFLQVHWPINENFVIAIEVAADLGTY
jgi:hypothetical protein